MGFYETYCLPHILDFACSMKVIRQQRANVVPQASGTILEIGMGSGLNIPYYDSNRANMVWGLEPSAGMREKARKRISNAPFEIVLIDLPGEKIPLDDNSVDTVLLTFTLCTIPDWQLALEQMRRVLKPGGKLIFCEHGKAPDEHINKWQNRVNPWWNKFAGGCNLNRPIPELIETSGFNIDTVESGYYPGPKLLNHFFNGVASPG